MTSPYALQQAILLRLERMIASVGQGPRFPFLILPDRVVCVEAARWRGHPGDWTAGFWPGMLWLAWSWTSDRRYADMACQACLNLLDRLEWDRHDLGFVFHPSCALGAQFTGDPRLRKAALTAAGRMLGLWDPKLGLLSIGPVPGEVQLAVDTLAALELLFWAADETADLRFQQVAVQHCHNALDVLLRSDGSTFHAARLKSGTGNLLWRGTWQGWHDDSCWSRGQAWAMYGASMVRRQTGNPGASPDGLDRLFDYWERQSPRNSLPPWDFHPQAPPVPDSSAAAVAASALLRHPDPARRQAGMLQLELLSRLALTGEASAEPGLLRHGCYHLPRKLGVDCGTVWGDFYFMAAVDAADRAGLDAGSGCPCKPPLPGGTENRPTD